METELKFLCSPSTLKVLSAHPLLSQLALDPPKSARLTSTYFDTPEFLLRKHGLGLRVRKIGKTWIQTLKGGGGVRFGLHQRDEWETPVAAKFPELRKLVASTGVHSRIAKILSDPVMETHLAPVFETAFKRRTWQLTLACGARMEVAMDTGEIRRGEWTEPISEMELELKSGHLESLFEVAAQLLDEVSFRIGRSSKAARGYGLVEPLKTEVRKADPISLPAECSIGKAISLILENCLNQVQGNECGVVSGENVESVHQMRVGLRRLRCALRFFGDWVAFPNPLRQELDWLSLQLGGARDWEVLGGSTLDALFVSRPSLDGLAELRQAILERARAQRRLAREALESDRYARLVLALSAWACKASKIPAHEPEEPWAAQILKRLHKKLLSKGESLETATPEERHRVRICAKRLRYATEFFGSRYPSKGVEKFTGRLRGLQDILGWFNDVTVAESLLGVIPSGQPSLSGTVQFALGWFGGRSSGDSLELTRHWERFAKMDPPWGG